MSCSAPFASPSCGLCRVARACFGLFVCSLASLPARFIRSLRRGELTVLRKENSLSKCARPSDATAPIEICKVWFQKRAMAFETESQEGNAVFWLRGLFAASPVSRMGQQESCIGRLKSGRIIYPAVELGITTTVTLLLSRSEILA